MNELTDNNENLQNRTNSSLDMTTDIKAQVQHVADMIERMVELTGESGQHAQGSYSDFAGTYKDNRNNVTVINRCRECSA